MLRWFKDNPLDVIKGAIAVIAVCFAAGVAWASINARIAELEADVPAIARDVREIRDAVRFLCAVTPGCAAASPLP